MAADDDVKKEQTFVIQICEILYNLNFLGLKFRGNVSLSFLILKHVWAFSPLFHRQRLKADRKDAKGHRLELSHGRCNEDF